MHCGAFTCHCFFCSRVQYGCKRDTPEKCNNCPFDFVCSQLSFKDLAGRMEELKNE